MLGHASPAMTQRYAHLSQGHLASEMATFEAAIPIRPAEGTATAGQGIELPPDALSRRVQ